MYTAELVRQLAARGHHLTLVCHEAAPELAGVSQVYHLPRSGFAQRPLAWRVAPLFQLGLCLRTLRSLPLTEPDIVIGSSQQLTWAHAHRYATAPLLYVPHSVVAPQEIATYPFVSPTQRRVAIGLAHYLERWALGHAARTVRFTEGSCVALAAHYHCRVSPRFVVFPVAVPVPPPARRGRGSGPMRLLCVGRLVETKNVLFLIRALARFVDRPWTLDLIGDGPERARLESETHVLRLDGRVTFHGHRDNVEDWYCAADLFVCPSRLEYGPLVVLEAMSFGLPALAMRSDGARFRNALHETITSGTDGFLAYGESHFTQLLDELLSTRTQLAEAGRRASLTVRQRHRWSDHISRYEALFRELRPAAATRGRAQVAV